MPGVVRTRVGYAGGSKPRPTYRALGDHTETTQIEFDPERLAYEDLLAVFWDSHTPTRPPWSRQYASIIFYHDEEQRRLAEESKLKVELRLERRLYTDIVPASQFYRAEDYHQKYYLRGVPGVMHDFERIYPDAREFTDSTAAARANGYVGGYGTLDDLRAEEGDFGLSPEALAELESIVRQVGGHPRGCG